MLSGSSFWHGKKIIIAGGGTGGHLFPGIAFAQQLPSKPIFLCTERIFDREQLLRYGFEFYQLPSPRFAVSLRFVIDLIKTLYATFKYFMRFHPDLIIGLGGYGAFAALVMAISMRIPFVLLEQNILPGKITRLFSPFARAVILQWPGSNKFFYRRDNTYITGSPIRKEITILPKIEAKKRLGLTKVKVFLIIGGSQGAQAVNNAVMEKVDILKRFCSKLSIIHLTGEKDFEAIKSLYRSNGIEAFVTKFCGDIALAYSAADVVLSRAGGIAISEMALFGIPMVLVPYPYAADNHQFLNALAISESGGGWLVTQTQLAQKFEDIANLIFDESQLELMSRKSMGLKIACKDLPTLR